MARITAALYLPDLEGEPTPAKTLKAKQNLYPLKDWVEDAAKSKRLGPPRDQVLKGVKFRGKNAKPFLADQLLYTKPIWRDMVVRRGGEEAGEALEFAQSVLPDLNDKRAQGDVPDPGGRSRPPPHPKDKNPQWNPPQHARQVNPPPKKEGYGPAPPRDKRRKGDLPDEKHKGKEKWPPITRSPPPSPPPPPHPKDKKGQTDIPDFPGRRNKPVRRSNIKPPQWPDDAPNPARSIPIRNVLPAVELTELNKPVHPTNKNPPSDKDRQRIPDEGYLDTVEEEEESRPFKQSRPKDFIPAESEPRLTPTVEAKKELIPTLNKPVRKEKPDILKPQPGEDDQPPDVPPAPSRNKPRSSRFGDRRPTQVVAAPPAITSKPPTPQLLRATPQEAPSRLSRLLSDPITPTDYFGGVASQTNRLLERKEYVERGKKIFERLRKEVTLTRDQPLLPRETEPVLPTPQTAEEQKPRTTKRKEAEAENPPQSKPSSLRLGKRQRTDISEEPRNRRLLDSLLKKVGAKKAKKQSPTGEAFEARVREIPKRKREEEPPIPSGEREKPKPFDLDIRNIPLPGEEPDKKRVKGRFLPHGRVWNGGGGDGGGGPDTDRGGERVVGRKPVRLRVERRPPPPPQRPKEKRRATDVLDTASLPPAPAPPKEKKRSQEPEDLGWTWLRREEPTLAPWGSTLEFDPVDTPVREERRGKKRKRKEERSEKEREEIRQKARAKAEERARELESQGRGDLAAKLREGLEAAFRETERRIGSIPTPASVVEYGRQVRQQHAQRDVSLSSNLRLSFRPGFTGDTPQRSVANQNLPAGPPQKKTRTVAFGQRQTEYSEQFRRENPDPALQTVSRETNRKNPTLVLRRK